MYSPFLVTGLTLLCNCPGPGWGAVACDQVESLSSDHGTGELSSVPLVTASQGNEINTLSETAPYTWTTNPAPRWLHLQQLQDWGSCWYLRIIMVGRAWDAPHSEIEARVHIPTCDQVPVLTFHMSDYQIFFYLPHWHVSPSKKQSLGSWGKCEQTYCTVF